MPDDTPATRFVSLGSDRVAYQVHGDGDVDVLYVSATGDQIELRWDWPAYADFRVLDAAAPGELLVSAAVPMLVAGAGFDFEDRGERALKGVPGTWQLFAVTPD